MYFSYEACNFHWFTDFVAASATFAEERAANAVANAAKDVAIPATQAPTFATPWLFQSIDTHHLMNNSYGLKNINPKISPKQKGKLNDINFVIFLSSLIIFPQSL